MMRTIIFIFIVQMTLASPSSHGKQGSKLDIQKFMKMNISEESLQKIRGINDGTIVVRDELPEMLGDLCSANIESDYPNPYNCQQVIQCGSSGPVVLACPVDTIYSPYCDCCAWITSETTCPLRYPWDGTTGMNPTCETIADNKWEDSILTLPAEPDLNCGTKLTYCNNYQTIDDGIARPEECPAGHGYSKAANACVEKCEEIDREFGLWKE